MSNLLTERWLRLAFAEDSTTVITESKKDPYDSCWDGYERVPGKKKDEKGSCRKEAADPMGDEGDNLWDNIRAKDERIKKGSGEKKAKPGDDDYPATLNVNESDETLDETDEGNAFSGARQDAIDAGEDEFEVDGEKYKVTGEKKHSMSESQLRRVIRKAILEACYDGRKVTLNKPSSNSDNPKKKSKVYVTGKGKYKSGACKGQNKAKKVQFGDPKMRIRKSNPKARSNFRARHKCSEDKPKDSAGYWSCKAW